MIDDDDVFSPILGRRQILRSAGSLGLLMGLGRLAAKVPGQIVAPQELDVSAFIEPNSMQGMCVMTPGETAGPYYLNLNLLRQNITEGLPGLATRLIISVVHASDCTPIPDATVDVWHANATGVYSGFANQGTQGQTFLRGVWPTDANGVATFDTIYPGWYMGRTTHIHLKVRPTPTSELTTQLYSPTGLSRRIYALSPYSAHGQNPTTNNTDGLFLPQTVVSVVGVGPLQLAITIGVA